MAWFELSQAAKSVVPLLSIASLTAVDAAAEPLVAGEELTAIEDLSLDDLLDLTTVVATREVIRLRDAPGTITVLTREEILTLGLRDLTDLLDLIQGFSTNIDVNGVLGIGYRGMWAHDGRILLLWDGLPLNERIYTTSPIGNRFPIDQIKRIEIIRGPGSVTYGGFAELAVVNIVPMGAEDLRGGRAAVTYGQLERTYGRRNLSLQAGHTWTNGSVTLAGYVGQSVISNDSFATFDEDAVRFGQNNARRDPLMLRGHGTWQNLSLRYLFESYRIRSRTAFGDELSPVPLTTSFGGHYFAADYHLALANGAVQVTPYLLGSWTRPWRQPRELDLDAYPSASYTFYDVSSLWGALGVRAVWAARPWLKLQAGVEGQWDSAFIEEPGNLETSFGDEEAVSYQNLAAYGEGFATTPFAEVTLGGRFEQHSNFGPSFVPRLSLTKQLGDLHWKFQAARSFRSPGIEQINSGLRAVPDGLTEPEAGIEPERTNTLELEVGYRLSSFAHLEVVGFSTQMRDPIIYGYDPGLELEYYVNGARTGSKGVEAAIKLRGRRGWLTASYSVFTTRGLNEVETYAVADRPDALLAMPNHKVVLSGKLSLLPGLTIAPSVIYLSDRYAYLTIDTDGEPVQGREDALWRMNLFLAYSPPWHTHLSVGLGVFDLLDDGSPYLQPYNGYHAPLPAPGRELVARVSYAVPFD